MYFFTLKDEHEKIVDALIEYCANELNLEVDKSEFADKEYCAESIKRGTFYPAHFFDFGLEEKYPDYVEEYIKYVPAAYYFGQKLDKK